MSVPVRREIKGVAESRVVRQEKTCRVLDVPVENGRDIVFHFAPLHLAGRGSQSRLCFHGAYDIGGNSPRHCDRQQLLGEKTRVASDVRFLSRVFDEWIVPRP
jgi:hypothetical protein